MWKNIVRFKNIASECKMEQERTVCHRKFMAGTFEGPLDLLWSLIRENKINIYDIPIAEITEQFQDYLDYAV